LRRKRIIEWSFVWVFLPFREIFSFVETLWSQASQRPSMTFNKFYSHVIETPPSKLETQHGVHKMWKKILCEVKKVEHPKCNSQNLSTHYCVWNVWFGWGVFVNITVYKCILSLYDFLNVFNILWDVFHSLSICVVCVWADCHPEVRIIRVANMMLWERLSFKCLDIF